MSETGDRIIDATMALLAERPFEAVTLTAIADKAGVSLATLAAHFPTRGHILDAFARRIDHEVLSRDTSDMAGEAPRDRLFDVLMNRLEALSPYKGAIKGLMQAIRRDPALGLALNAISVRSATWMLAAAGLAPVGWRGRFVTQGLAVTFARVLRVFVDETDPGLPRTMAALDKALREDEERYQRASRVFGDAVREAPLGEATAATAPAASAAMDGTPDSDAGIVPPAPGGPGHDAAAPANGPEEAFPLAADTASGVDEESDATENTPDPFAPQPGPESGEPPRPGYFDDSLRGADETGREDPQ